MPLQGTPWRHLRLAACALLAISVSTAHTAHAAPLTVQVTGLQNNQGEVRCGLFTGETGWRDETRASLTATSTIQNHSAVCHFGDVAPGRYAVALFHAQDGEKKVSYGFLGKPKQGVGFSNNPSITFGPPDYHKAAFEVGATPLTIRVEMKY